MSGTERSGRAKGWQPRGGTALAMGEARRLGRPLRVVRLDAGDPPGALAGTRAWLADERVSVLNVAGPRASEDPGVADAAASFLRAPPP